MYMYLISSSRYLGSVHIHYHHLNVRNTVVGVGLDVVTDVCTISVLKMESLVALPKGNTRDGSRAVGYIEPQVLAHLADTACAMVVD